MTKGIELAHKICDDYNVEWGDKGCLCCFCESKDYDGEVGIIHEIDCVILILRDVMKTNDS